jgi:sugar/nucleoside kinase (ribokinase family)
MIDVVVAVPELPVSGGDVMATDSTTATGGGFNIMSAARRQGALVSYLGKLGTGPFSDIARADLRNEGLDVVDIEQAGIDAGRCLVIVEPEGERTFITVTGAEQLTTAGELQNVALGAGDIIYLSGYNFVYPALGEVFRQWMTLLPNDVSVALDPGPRVLDIDPEVLEQVLSRCDWLLCNDDEAKKLSGEENLTTAMVQLAKRTRHPNVVVRVGAEGCLASINGDVIVSPGFVVTAIDTNGAGDTHNGVFLANLMQGVSHQASLERANAASALAIQKLGPATCPHAADISAYLATF